MLFDSHFSGRDGFYSFQGVVEDRSDPDFLGRVKVRILGAHTPDKSFITSEQLLWASVIQPITSPAMNGIGTTPIGPVPGTWVFGYFRDGPDQQEPCIIGTIGGIPQSIPNNTLGFNDPRDFETDEKLVNSPRQIASRQYPTDGTGAKLINGTSGIPYPKPDYLNEPDTNRIARNEKINLTVLQIISDILDKNVPISFGGSWNEPVIWYDGVYPYIHVSETESGHVKVCDDTPNSEGQLDFDRSGTFRQIQTDGSEIHKIVTDHYTIVMKDDFIHVMNNENNRVEKECNISIGGRWNVEVTGNINIKGHAGIFLSVDGDANIQASGNVNITSVKDTNIVASGNVNIKASESLSVSSEGDINFTAAGNFAIDSTAIFLNSNKAQATNPTQATLPKQ